MKIEIRRGSRTDLPELLACIKELAVYEKAGDQVEVTVEELERDGFGEHPLFQFIVATTNNKIIGIALYYFKYSTWKGKALFLEDIIVKEEARQQGIGSKLFVEICKIAHQHRCRRMDWQVLDWNEPAIQFYKKYKANLNDEWLNGQFFANDLKRINEEN